jgi:serine protease Do
MSEKRFFSRQFFLLGLLLFLMGGLMAVDRFSGPVSSPAAAAEKTNSPELEERLQLVEEKLEKIERRLSLAEGYQIISEEEERIMVVEKTLPSVVSVVASKKVALYSSWFDWPGLYNQPEEEREISSGTGFLVTKEGMILTNKHVVEDEEANYTVITNEGEKYSAEVLARDPFQDLALIKIEGEGFQPVTLGDSSELKLGESVISIGNALGEFQNTVSTGIISGLSRNINASGGGKVEALNNVIQTDAAINVGNSGGPLLNLRGEVIGINVAMAQSAENIAFSIPINQAKKAIQQVEAEGKIIYPYLGIRYLAVNQAIQEKYELEMDSGALLVRGDSVLEPAVDPNSAADQMGLKEGDIILEIDGQRIDNDHLLGDLISDYQPGDKVVLKVWRDGQIKTFSGSLGSKES